MSHLSPQPRCSLLSKCPCPAHSTRLAASPPQTASRLLRVGLTTPPTPPRKGPLRSPLTSSFFRVSLCFPFHLPEITPSLFLMLLAGIFTSVASLSCSVLWLRGPSSLFKSSAHRQQAGRSVNVLRSPSCLARGILHLAVLCRSTF